MKRGLAAILLSGLFMQGPEVAEALGHLQAEPQEPTGKFTTAVEVKPILEATQGSWVAVREWEGQDLVYVTHLWAWRCGLVQIEVSINAGPFQVWPMPACHADTAAPNAILEEDGLPYATFPLHSVIELSVRITYDDLSTGMVAFPRADVMTP